MEYISADEEITRYSREKNVPEYLQEKLGLLRHFTDYMDKHLTEGKYNVKLLFFFFITPLLFIFYVP